MWRAGTEWVVWVWEIGRNITVLMELRWRGGQPSELKVRWSARESWESLLSRARLSFLIAFFSFRYIYLLLWFCWSTNVHPKNSGRSPLSFDAWVAYRVKIARHNYNLYESVSYQALRKGGRRSVRGTWKFLTVFSARWLSLYNTPGLLNTNMMTLHRYSSLFSWLWEKDQ